MTEQNIPQNDQSIDPFQLALQKRQQAEKEREDAKNNQQWGDYEQTEAVGLVQGKEVVGRIIGNPIEIRKQSTDPKLILQSEVVKDDKKGYWKINWPIVEKNGYMNPDPDWIVTRFMKKVFDGKWTKYVESDIDGKKIVKREGKIINTETKSKFNEGEFRYYNTHTEIFKLLKYGNSKEGELYPKNFEPSKRVVLNWLDRMDSWCSDNKHYKLLCAAKNPYEFKKDDGTTSTIYFTSTGIPNSLYDMIIDHCKATGTLDIDLILIKDNKLQAKYKVWDITDTKYISEESTRIGKKGNLSDEEKSYVGYDLDKLYKVSSYHKIKKVLGSRFALCDAELGTSFVKELDALVEHEKAEWEANKVYYYYAETNTLGWCTREEFEKMCSTSPEIVEISKEKYEEKHEELKKKFESQESSTPTEYQKQGEQKPIEQIPSRRGDSVDMNQVQQETEKIDIETQCKQIFKFWDNLADLEKSIMINSIDYFDGNIPMYKETGHPGCSNKECYYEGTKVMSQIPNGVNSCPVCGVVF
jgi:hypothetical protein